MTPPEPVALGDVDTLQSLRERLEARGIDLSQPAEPEPKGETPEERAERMRLRHQRAVTRWESQRPVMYADADVRHLDAVDQAAVRVADWVRDRDALNLVLAGGVGTGKTYAAYAVGNLLIQANRTVEAWTVHDLLEAMRPGGDGAPYATRADCLILDDIGASQPTEWAVQEMTAMLDARLRAELRTIVTTNLTEAQISEAWGERFMDRLRHRAAVIIMRGESRRSPAW